MKLKTFIFFSLLSVYGFAQPVLPHIWLDTLNLAVHTFTPYLQMTPQGDILAKLPRVDLDNTNTMHGSGMSMFKNNGVMKWDTIYANPFAGLIDFVRQCYTDSSGNTWVVKDDASPSHQEFLKYDTTGQIIDTFMLNLSRIFHYNNSIVSNINNLEFIPDHTDDKLYFVTEPIDLQSFCSNDITTMMYIDPATNAPVQVDSIHFNDCADNIFCFIRDQFQDFYFLNSEKNLNPGGKDNHVVISKLVNQQITPIITIDSQNMWLEPKAIRKIDRWLMCNYISDTNTTHNYAIDVMKFYDMSVFPPALVNTRYFELKLTEFTQKDGAYYVGEKYDITQTPDVNFNQVHKIDPQGNILWSYTLDSNTILKTIVVNNGYVYAVAERNDSTILYEIFSATGTLSTQYALYPDFMATIGVVDQAIIGENDAILYLSGYQWNMGHIEALVGKYKIKSMGSVGTTPAAITQKTWNIAPNPAQDNLHISFAEPLKNATPITIYDVCGKKVFSQTVTDRETNISLEGWSKGMYFLMINDKTEKFVKE